MTTMTFMLSSRPADFSALSAWMMMTSPPFMSMMPGPARGVRVDPLELLKRTVALEHRVEMSDQQNLR